MRKLLIPCLFLLLLIGCGSNSEQDGYIPFAKMKPGMSFEEIEEVEGEPDEIVSHGEVYLYHGRTFLGMDGSAFAYPRSNRVGFYYISDENIIVEKYEEAFNYYKDLYGEGQAYIQTPEVPGMHQWNTEEGTIRILHGWEDQDYQLTIMYFFYNYNNED